LVSFAVGQARGYAPILGDRYHVGKGSRWTGLLGKSKIATLYWPDLRMAKFLWLSHWTGFCVVAVGWQYESRTRNVSHPNCATSNATIAWTACSLIRSLTSWWPWRYSPNQSADSPYRPIRDDCMDQGLGTLKQQNKKLERISSVIPDKRTNAHSITI
jgi:hypothetical protein